MQRNQPTAPSEEVEEPRSGPTIGASQICIPVQEHQAYIPARGRQQLILGVSNSDLLISNDCELR